MITENYVSFETAKLLKEKGFYLEEAEKYATEISYCHPLKEQDAAYQRGLYDGCVLGHKAGAEYEASKYTLIGTYNEDEYFIKKNKH